MQYVQKNNDIISVQTGEIRARIVMLNTEEVRFGIMYGVINEMDRDEILDYVASYSGVNGVFETFESAMAHAMASMQPVPTPFVADHYEEVNQNSDHARRIAGETPEMAHAHYEAIEQAEKPNLRYLWFGIYLVSVDSERLVIQCGQGTDLSGSENLQNDVSDGLHSRLTYSPNADGNYRLAVNIGIVMPGQQPIIWEFIIDAMGNCTRKRI